VAGALSAISQEQDGARTKSCHSAMMMQSDAVIHSANVVLSRYPILSLYRCTSSPGIFNLITSAPGVDPDRMAITHVLPVFRIRTIGLQCQNALLGSRYIQSRRFRKSSMRLTNGFNSVLSTKALAILTGSPKKNLSYKT